MAGENKYSKVGTENVLLLLIREDLEIGSSGVRSLKFLAQALNTSQYQVRKHINYLMRLGIVERIADVIESNDENFIRKHYTGYCLTSLIISKDQNDIPDELITEKTDIFRYRALYQKELAREIKLMRECFGVIIE